MSQDERRGWVRAGIVVFLVVTAVGFAAAGITLPDWQEKSILLTLGFFFRDLVRNGN
jgi:hypothetical protein|tara:strand:- start:1773 stop:1943 length:171 start_codon:yes stop_codon:yes gene_type:complete